MHRSAARLALVAAALFLACHCAAAQQTPDAVVKQVVDGVMQRYLAETGVPGAIVGVSMRGRRYFFAYGSADDAGTPFSPDTLVEIGSCTKTFTTTLFALAIDRRQIAATASAQTYMPSGYSLTPAAQPITPLELADFTSGLPDDPTNLPRRLERRGIRHYTSADFLNWVAQWTPATSLPAPYLYSNAGIGLLSYLVMTATGKSWAEQLDAEILRPLTMRDTALRPTPQQRQRLATGHRRNGGDAPPWPIFAWYAAGGLRSTARDMVSFAEANLGHTEVNGRPVPAELTAALQLAQKPIYILPNGFNQQAMAWVANLGKDNPNLHPVIVKNGGTVGFSSVIALNPSKDLAVFIAVNRSGARPTAKGMEIARHLP